MFFLLGHSNLPAAELIKPGIYGASPSPRSVTFAPNVTPGTYSDDVPFDDADNLALPPDAQLFPPSEQPPNPASKRRAPPGKRRSLGYIPRPPNAFMLFRADFVRQKHVPGSIETNHGSLSKIIGNCWRALPLEEKRIWEIKAKQEKEAHSKKYPGYRFRPVHNKNKDKKKAKPAPTFEDEQRCEEVAQLLLEGIKGDELAAAIRKLDEKKMAVPAPQPQHQPFYPPRRPSSVPLPDSRFHHIALPSVPFFAQPSRSASPVGNISRSARMIIGQRRPSSALPHFGRTSWGVDDIPLFPSAPAQDFYSPSLQRDQSPLPEPNTSLFEEAFNFGFPAGSGEPVATVRPPLSFVACGIHTSRQTYNDFFSSLPPHAPSASPSSYPSAPMDQVPPSDFALPLHMDLDLSALTVSQLDLPHPGLAPSWMPTPAPMEPTTSGPSSTYSGSPAHSDLSLPVVAAPRPQHAPAAGLAFDMWPDLAVDGKVGDVFGYPVALAVAGVDVCADHQISMPIGSFEMLFDGAYVAGMQAF